MRIPVLIASILVLALSLSAADQKNHLTLPEFRSLVQEQGAGKKTPPDLERADEVFLRLLAAQGRKAAAGQSLDRLSGWYKATQARVRAQGAPSSDLELLRFAAERAASRVAQSEADRLKALREANLLLKRPPDSPLVALVEMPAATVPEKAGKKPKSAVDASSAANLNVPPDLASRKMQFEKELLPLGQELLRTLYQNYLFGGIPVTSLLWQEQQLYQTELQYRKLLVEGEMHQARQQTAKGNS